MKKRWLILWFFPVIAFAQIAEHRSKTEWLVQDTATSMSFIRKYKEALVRVKGDSAEEDLSSKILTEDQIIVEVGFLKTKTVLNSVKAIDMDGAITPMNTKVLAAMDPVVIGQLMQRGYQWDEVNKSMLKNYSSDIETIFELRNNKECRDNFWWASSRVQFVLPSDWIVRLNEQIGLGISLSNDEYGYPYGFNEGGPGIVKLSLIHQIAKVFVTLPVILNRNALEGGYGLGCSVDDINYGGGFMMQDVGFYKNPQQTHMEDDSLRTMYLRQAGYCYYSLTHDFGKMIQGSSLRWKIGPAVMVYSKGTALDDQATKWNYSYDPELALYARVELMYGKVAGTDFRQLEFAFQGIIGNHRHLLFSTTYNLANWFGVELKAASITPSDSWRHSFTFSLQPKFRL
jgi:hypothetical protein